MKQKERVTYISRRLDELYPEPPIPLEHKDSYTLLIAVLLSAQCTDVRVNKTTPMLFALADEPSAMVKLSVDEINAVVRPCGLAPRKATAIRNLSQILLEKHEGKVLQLKGDQVNAAPWFGNPEQLWHYEEVVKHSSL